LGLRQGEILGLAWSDIDFEARTITVRQALQRVKGKDGKGTLTLVEPKTFRSCRVLVLPQLAVSGLAEHHRRQSEERCFAGERWSEKGLVFTTSVGTPLDQRNLLRTFYAIQATGGLPEIRFHDLRHSAATLLLAQGVHPRFVMELLGHSTITLTMNTYSHVLDDMKRETASKMDDALNPLAVKLAVRRSKDRAN
jgi:integrase